MRGFKKDLPATKAAHFADKRSFVSLPKLIVGECTEPKPHLVLFGIDKSPIRAEIFRRNRKENGIRGEGMAQCWKCCKLVWEYADESDPQRGHWHHLRHKPGTRCDCPSNGVVSCSGTCHQAEHVQVRLRSGKIMQSPEELC